MQAEKIKLAKAVKDLQRDIADAQKKVKGTDFRQMIDVSKKVIKLQAWFRMKLIAKRLRQSTKKN